MSQKMIDSKIVEAMAFRAVGDLGGAFVAAQGYLGDRLGLFKTMAGQGPISSARLAEKTGLNPRYVEEWLRCMAAAEYVEHDPAGNLYWITDEHAAVLADENSPIFMGGAFQTTLACIFNTSRMPEVYKNGGGLSLEELGPDVIEGVERMFKPGYLHALVQDWLQKVPGLVQKLEKGGHVLDVGCGCGQSTVAMAKAFPRSAFVGVDSDPLSIKRASKLAVENGASNVQFLRVSALDVPRENKFDLICFFDCLHDMPDQGKILGSIRNLLKDGGACLLSEPFTSDNPVENRNPVGRMFAGVSPLYCLTVSMAQSGKGTGNQLGEKGVRDLAKEAGFSGVEKLPIQNPINQFFLLKK